MISLKEITYEELEHYEAMLIEKLKGYIMEVDKGRFDWLDNSAKHELDRIVQGLLTDNLMLKELLDVTVTVLHKVYTQLGESIVPDDEYDKLYAINISVNDKQYIGDKVASIKKYAHKYPSLRGTVDKVHYVLKSEKPDGDKRKSYEEWINNIQRQGISLSGVGARLSLKVDGVSAIIEGEEGVSKRVLKRGDTENNEAENIPILENKSFPDMKEYNEFGLKTEIYMTNEMFEDFKKEYGEFNSPRSAITSIINSDTVDLNKLRFIKIYDIEAVGDGDVILPENIYFTISDLTDYETIRDIVDKLEVISIEKGIPADGVVIRINDDEIVDTLGRKDAINKFEVGFKFTAKKFKTYLRSVEFSMGKQGTFTPVAKVDPLILNGNRVSSINLGSVARLKTLDLRIGQPVYITYNIIPYLYDCSPNEKEGYDERVRIILDCPTCDHELSYINSALVCENYECEGNVIGRLLNWTVKTGVEGVGESAIVMIVRQLDVRTRAELYELDTWLDFIESDVPGYDTVSALNLINAYEYKKEIPFDVFIGALGIYNIGRSKMKTILSHFTRNEFMKMILQNNFNEITKIKGIGEVDVKSLTDWFADEVNSEEFHKLMGVVTVLDPTRDINSHSILFTKVRDYEFQKFLEDKGFHIADKYNKSVDVVIAGDESKKTEKARKDGKLVVPLDVAKEIYGYVGGQ